MKEFYGSADKFYHLMFITHVYKFASKPVSFCIVERKSWLHIAYNCVREVNS